MDLLQVGQEREDGFVAERNKDDTVMGQGGESGVDSHFLPATRSASGNEDAGILAGEGTRSPEPTSSIPKGLSGYVSLILSNRRGGECRITFH